MRCFFRKLTTSWRHLKSNFAFCLTAKRTEARYVIFADDVCHKHNYTFVTKYRLLVNNYKSGDNEKYQIM